MIIDESNHLLHYGILRKSGRYPWGSGDDVTQRSKSFLDNVEKLKAQGLNETEIAKGLGFKSTTDLREAKSIANHEIKQADITTAQRLKDKGMSNVAIGKQMGKPESTIRALLAPGQKDRNDVLQSTTKMLKEEVDSKKYIDVGKGVENQLGISKQKLATAVSALKEEGYQIHYVKVQQQNTGKYTTFKVLAPPDVPYSEVYRNRAQIQQIQPYSQDGGRSYTQIHTPVSFDSKRLAVRYAEQGGTQADGVVYVRPGVKDLSLGKSNYAQVRILVDGTHFIKGMAMYKDDLPPGVDLSFNTNKKNTGNKLDALKPIKDDPDNPFGSSIRRQLTEIDAHGNEKVTSVMNIVAEEGKWDKESRSLSSQVLSKQSPLLAKSQLDMTYQDRRQQLDDIKALTNPEVRKKLLQSYADGTDAASVHLKAAALPGQSTHVILPIESMKQTEVYAPNFQNGDRVVLIRHPHGGIFEIPELTVNNRQRDAKKMLGLAPDAIGINAKVAEKLSGADFDGDTVLVIPNMSGKIKTAPTLAQLKDFDAKATYRIAPENTSIRRMTKAGTQLEMGLISNLITDMTIKGASADELARAVKHSMVVIDAEKHGLNYKQSYLDNNILQLKEKYQKTEEGRAGGASTLISRASSEQRVLKRNPRRASKGGPIDPETGQKVWEYTGESYEKSRVSKRTGEVTTKTVMKTDKSTKLAEVEDAFKLTSKPAKPIEIVYAEHSNRLKALANEARKELVHTKSNPVSNSAKKAYATEVSSLNAKLNVALKNAPLERQAQLIANTTVASKRTANPDMDADELKKVKRIALNEARIRTGAKSHDIFITDTEWDAIQAGAISSSKLTQILGKADEVRVKQLATPKSSLLMTPIKTNRAKTMLASGYTQAEVAQALGVSLTTLKSSVSEGV